MTRVNGQRGRMRCWVARVRGGGGGMRGWVARVRGGDGRMLRQGRTPQGFYRWLQQVLASPC